MSAAARLAARDRPVFAGLLLLLAWMPLPWGSHTPWAASLLAFAAAVLLCAWLLLAAAGRARLPAGGARLLWPLLAWLAWIGWIALQLVPLDAARLAALSPASQAVHATVGTLTAQAPLYTTSIAPSLTADALLLTLGYFALYWLTVLTCFERPARLQWLLVVIVASGVLQAVYGSFMVLSNQEWGFFARKAHYLDSATGTFVSRNHFAGYLGLAAAAGTALVLADLRAGRGRRSLRRLAAAAVDFLLSPRLRARVALVLIVVGVVMSRSRMGNASLFASLALCGFLFVLVRERQWALRAALLFASMAVVDLFIVSRYFGLEALMERVEQTELTREGRTRLLAELPPVIDAYAATGAGLGTFALAYAGFRAPGMQDHFDHAHNDWAQFLVETGVPGLLLLLLLAGMHLLHALRVIVTRRRPQVPALCFASVMALVTCGLHSSLEFNLQIPAYAGTLVVLMAIAACCGSRSRRRTAPTPAGAIAPSGSAPAAGYTAPTAPDPA